MENILLTETKLKPEITNKIRKSKKLKMTLMAHFNISNSTLQLWLDKNSGNFTQYGVLRILMSHFDCNDLEDLLSINPKK
ncbi:MAG: hypothetical protein HQ565_02340 [Bacteroidetes bacterium]|nr:hypothetical protein [Bacteroidota bacterium]